MARRDEPTLRGGALKQRPSGSGLRIAFVGCVSEGYKSLEHLLRRGELVLSVFTLREDLAAGVSGAMRFDELAARHEVPLVKVQNINDEDNVDRIRALSPDLVLVIGWTQLVKPPILRIPRYGCIGFHASLLPRYRGRAPVNWAIIRGETRTGNTMIQLADGIDDGDILAQREIPIGFEDTCATVYDRVAETEFEMLDEVLPMIRDGRVVRRKQDPADATIMPRRRPEDGQIDWGQSAVDIYNWVRALTHPYPGAFTYLGSAKVFVWKASLASSSPGLLSPGQTRAVEAGLFVGTGSGSLLLDRVQEDGEAEISGQEFAARQLGDGTTMFHDPTRNGGTA